MRCIAFEGDTELRLTEERLKQLKSKIRNLLKKQIAMGRTVFYISPTQGFNFLVASILETLPPAEIGISVSIPYDGFLDVSDGWLNLIEKLNIKFKCKLRSLQDYRGSHPMSYYSNCLVANIDFLVVYHKHKPKGLCASMVHMANNHYYASILNLADTRNSTSTSRAYKGVRLRKNGQTWYYRIKRKLPNGEEICIEKGGYATAEEAYKARELKLKELTKLNIKIENHILFDAVFLEFLSTVTSYTSSIKYISVYRTHIQQSFSSYSIVDIDTEVVKKFMYHIQRYERAEKTDTFKQTISNTYRQVIKRVLSMIFDYAYTSGYITIHPMYGLPKTW